MLLAGLAQLEQPSAPRLHRAIPYNHGEPATRIRGWNNRRRARTMRRASQRANTRKIPTITRITTGWNAISTDAPTAITSSPRLSRLLEKGSGDVLAAKRVAAFVPCKLSATPPPANSATRRTEGSKCANAEAASTAPAGIRMNVCTASQIESTAGILSAALDDVKNSRQADNPPMFEHVQAAR